MGLLRKRFQGCPKCGASNPETCRRWCAEDAAFALLVKEIADGWRQGYTYGTVLKDCPDLTQLAMHRFGVSDTNQEKQ